MVENSELCYRSSADLFEADEIVPEEAAPPPKKVSFLERFFIRSNDALIGLTAGLKVPNTGGNHWDMPR